MSTYYIVYPRGDKNKLAVVEICSGLEYELSDYCIASREYFYDEIEAIEYAFQLAKNNNLELSLSYEQQRMYPESQYLD